MNGSSPQASGKSLKSNADGSDAPQQRCADCGRHDADRASPSSTIWQPTDELEQRRTTSRRSGSSACAGMPKIAARRLKRNT